MSAVTRAVARLSRDVRQGLPLTVVAKKSLRYLYELSASKLYLRDVDQVGEGVRTLMRPHIDNQGTITVGRHTLLRSINVPIELAAGPDALLEIGDECSLNYGVSIGCMKHVRIGNRCRFGPYVMIVDSAFHSVYDRAQRPEPEPVFIEDDVWVGAKANIMPGVTIGRGSIVGTASVVTRDVEPFSVVAGVPARLVRKLDPAKFVTPPPAQ